MRPPSRRASRHIRVYGMAMEIGLGPDEAGEENKTATMKQMNLSGDNFYYYRGAEFDYYRKHLDFYNAAVGKLMEQGIRIVGTARSGGDPEPYFAELRKIYADFGEGRLKEIGIPLPDILKILDASATVLERQAQALIQSEMAARLATERAVIKMDNSNYAGGDGASSPTQVISAAREAFLERMRAAHDVLEMYAADGVTVIGMGGKPFSTTADTGTLHGSAGTGVIVASLGGIEGLGIQSAIDSHNLQVINGEWPKTETVHPLANGASTITFKLDQPSMVNFWVDTEKLGTLRAPLSQALIQPDVSLALAGTGLSGIYASDKPGEPGAGESISSVLPAGTYTLVLRDRTDYRGAGSLRLPGIGVGINIKPYTTQKIEGRMSVPGREVTMPVSMSVAEFKNGQRNTDYSQVSKLDPSKPVWVVIPGREDNENSGKMTELSRALYEAGNQVVTFDWSEGAKDNVPHLFGLQGEQWIEAAGEKLHQFLKAAGVPGENIRFGVHSWGTFVSFEVAERYMKDNGFGVQAIVALDPAKDPTLKIGYDASQVDFGKVSRTAWSFHSSFWGSVPRVFTGDRAIEIRSPGVISPTSKHGLAVMTFANLVRLQKIDPANEIASRFSLSMLDETSQSSATSRDTPDGWMWVDSHEQGSNGDRYFNAIPTQFTLTNPDDDKPDVYFHSNLTNLEQELKVP